MISSGSVMARLLGTLPQIGTVVWIGVRPARRAEVVPVAAVHAEKDRGLAGDHYAGKLTGKRQVTLINAEHLVAIASMLGRPEVSPLLLRRNLVVKGINLLALKDKPSGSARPCWKPPASVTPARAWKKIWAPAATTRCAATVASRPGWCKQEQFGWATG